MSVRDIVYSAVPRFISIFSGLVATIILTRGLTTDGYGQYVFWLSVIMFASGLTDFSFSTFIKFYVPRQDNDIQFSILTYGFGIVSLFSSIGIMAVSGFFFFREEDVIVIIIAAVVLALDVFNKYTLSSLQSLREFPAAATSQTIHTVGKIAVFFGVIAILPTPTGALVGLSLSYLGGLLIALGFLFRVRSPKIQAPNWSSLRVSFNQFAPFEVMNRVTKEILGSAPVWVLLTLFGPTVVAYWGILKQFRYVIVRVVSPVNDVFFPDMSEESGSGNDLSKFVAKYIKYCLILVLPFIVGGTVLRVQLIVILFGEKYEPAASALPLFLGGAFFAALTSLPYFGSQGRTRARLIIGIFTSSVVTAGIYLGGSVGELDGAAAGYLIGLFLTTVLTYGVIFHEIRQFDISLIRAPQVLIALFALVIVVTLIEPHVIGIVPLVGAILGSGAAYLVVVMKNGTITSEEKENIITAAPTQSMARFLNWMIN